MQLLIEHKAAVNYMFQVLLAKVCLATFYHWAVFEIFETIFNLILLSVSIYVSVPGRAQHVLQLLPRKDTRML